MGFGFNLLVTFLVLPLSAILLFLSFTSKRKVYKKILLWIWIGVLSLVLFSTIVQYLNTKQTVQKKDIYGSYIIDRTQFSGANADWQYNHFRFEITPQNQFLFHQTDQREIIKTDTANVEFLEQYLNHRIIIHPTTEMHHIVETKPTLYRQLRSFYYVFKSPQFGNVFFKKGIWQAIDETN